MDSKRSVSDTNVLCPCVHVSASEKHERSLHCLLLICAMHTAERREPAAVTAHAREVAAKSRPISTKLPLECFPQTKPREAGLETTQCGCSTDFKSSGLSGLSWLLTENRLLD